MLDQKRSGCRLLREPWLVSHGSLSERVKCILESQEFQGRVNEVGGEGVSQE